jgi:hypothetical protein
MSRCVVGAGDRSSAVLWSDIDNRLANRKAARVNID